MYLVPSDIDSVEYGTWSRVHDLVKYGLWSRENALACTYLVEVPPVVEVEALVARVQGDELSTAVVTAVAPKMSTIPVQQQQREKERNNMCDIVGYK